MLLVLTFCFGATVANAASKPAVVVSQVKFLADISGGGFTAGGTPAGGSFAVTKAGKIAVATTYGGEIDLFDIATGTVANFASDGGPAGFAVDSQGNLFHGTLWDTKVYKVPYVDGAYATARKYNNCAATGQDTERCVVPSLSGSLSFKAFTFDAAGNLFAVTAAPATAGGNAIYEVAAADLYTAGTAKLVFTDDAPHAIGSIAVDPWGNLFFTDVVISNADKGQASGSALNVLPYSASTGYGAKQVLVTYTNPTPLTDYNNVLGGVNVDPASGTVYYSDTNTGTFAFANNPLNFADITHAYMVSTKGNYQIAPDGNGNLWAVAYDNAVGKAGVYHIAINNFVAPKSAIGLPAQVTDVVTALSRVGCSGTPVTFAPASDNAATASADISSGATCSTKSFGDAPSTVNAAVLPTTVSITPAVPGINVATLVATDSANNTGTFTITGSAEAGTASQTITFPNPGPQAVGTSITLSATTDAGLTVSFASTTTDVCTVSGITATFVTVGTCTIEASQLGNNTYGAATPVSQSFTINGPAIAPTFSPAGGTYTTNQTVTISDTTPGAVIHYTVDGSAPTATSPVYSSPLTVAVNTTIKAIAVAPNYPDSAIASVTYTVIPDFTFATSSTSVSVPAGGSGNATLTISRIGGFNDAVWFACSGLPAGYTCSFSPAAIMPSTSTTASTTITITKPASVFASLRHGSLFASMTLTMSLCFFGFGTRRRRLQLLMLLALAITTIAVLASCGGSSSTPKTQPVNANVTVTARSGALQHSVTLTLTGQ